MVPEVGEDIILGRLYCFTCGWRRRDSFSYLIHRCGGKQAKDDAFEVGETAEAACLNCDNVERLRAEHSIDPHRTRKAQI